MVVSELSINPVQESVDPDTRKANDGNYSSPYDYLPDHFFICKCERHASDSTNPFIKPVIILIARRVRCSLQALVRQSLSISALSPEYQHEDASQKPPYSKKNAGPFCELRRGAWISESLSVFPAGSCKSICHMAISYNKDESGDDK